VYDPAARHELEARYDGEIELAADAYSAIENADALAVLTDWTEFKTPDFRRIKASLRQPVIFDGRNLYEPTTLDDYGLLHYAVGRTGPDRMLVMERLAGHDVPLRDDNSE